MQNTYTYTHSRIRIHHIHTYFHTHTLILRTYTHTHTCIHIHNTRIWFLTVVTLCSQAAAAFQQVLILSPTNTHALCGMAEVALLKGDDVAVAHTHAVAAVASAPQCVAALGALGWIEFNRDDVAPAEQHLREAIAAAGAYYCISLVRRCGLPCIPCVCHVLFLCLHWLCGSWYHLYVWLLRLVCFYV